MTSYIPFAFSILYVLGAVLHYLHVMAVLQLTDNVDNMNVRKVYWNSAVWPITVFGYIFMIMTMSDEDYDE